MNCEKCDAAIVASEMACRTCGGPARKSRRNWSKFAKFSVIALVIAACAVYVAFHSIGFGDGAGGTGGAIGSESEPPEPPAMSYNGDAGESGESGVVFVRRDATEIEAMLNDVYVAVTAYMFAHRISASFLTSMGFLYNATTSQYVTIELLVEAGHLSEDFLDENVLILYLRPNDLAVFDEFVAGEADEVSMGLLTVFLGHDVPAGVGLFTTRGTHLIFRENLNQILLDYRPFNGQITRPGAEADVYWAVVNAIEEANPGRGVFLRYLAVDERHGFAAFTLAGNETRLHTHILAIEHGEENFVAARVLARDFEMAHSPLEAINTSIPNFNFALMPDFDIAPGRVGLQSEDAAFFRELIDTIRYDGLIFGYEWPLFASVSRTHAYVVLPDGQAFFGQRRLDEWVLMPLGEGGWQEAHRIMVGSVPAPPLYILWQH